MGSADLWFLKRARQSVRNRLLNLDDNSFGRVQRSLLLSAGRPTNQLPPDLLVRPEREEFQAIDL